MLLFLSHQAVQQWFHLNCLIIHFLVLNVHVLLHRLEVQLDFLDRGQRSQLKVFLKTLILSGLHELKFLSNESLGLPNYQSFLLRRFPGVLLSVIYIQSLSAEMDLAYT
ncbi:MAG: hypothetical protein K0R51_2739 [Cytophagaceae bacterium]|nr:hypothetical protein [Cytophagaceae bacterium]